MKAVDKSNIEEVIPQFMQLGGGQAITRSIMTVLNNKNQYT